MGASYSLEAKQGRKGITGINCGGAISGGRDFWTEEEGKVTSRTRHPSVLTGGSRLSVAAEKKQKGAAAVGFCWAGRACAEREG